MKTITLFLVAIVFTIALQAQEKSPKLVFVSLDKAYQLRDTVLLSKLYLHVTENDKVVSRAAIKLLMMKQDLNKFSKDANAMYPTVFNNLGMLDFVIGMIAQPAYFLEKSTSAKITISDNEATSEYVPSETECHQCLLKDNFIKIKDNWYISPYLTSTDKGEQLLKITDMLETMLKKGNELMSQKVTKEDFIKKLKSVLPPLD